MADSVTFWIPDLILSVLSVSNSSLSAAMASSIASIVVGSTLSACSSIDFSVEWMRLSAWFFASISSRRSLSASALSSASLTIWSISASDRPPDAWIVICCSLPVPLSLAPTDTIPLASMSKVTSICGMPRGAGGMFSRLKLPRILLSAAISRSPWKTRMVTALWLSSAVEKICDFFVGIVVLRSIRRVNTPPRVSIPMDRGVTSSRTTSLTSPCRTPA
mmetsp:Transcript_23002/g.38864  ORF Transcript_23002/g.38864 Transcript_23002/m.38864 type:complete len:219 (+) Transcript_23002:9049-9705(+)